MTRRRFEPAHPDELGLEEGHEPADVFYRRQVHQLQERLEHHPPTDPGLRRRLEHDLAAAERAVDAATISVHWASGEGDRKLF